MRNISNPNDQYTYKHGLDKVFNAHQKLRAGEIYSTSNMRDAHMTLTYDVILYASNAILTNCKVAMTGGDNNGNGDRNPLEKGMGVLLLMKDGNMQQPIIVGTFHTNGKHDAYLNKGELKKPGDRIASGTAPAAQSPSGKTAKETTDGNK